jgi:hypothetical protein
MNKSEMREKLERAVRNLFANQPNIFEFTSETRQTEWNLAHHLAIEVHKMFPELDCDLDVVKVNLENRRPDVIFHKRGTHESNYLVIEVKRDGHPADIRDDIEKIRSYWFEDRLHYRFGAVINLKSNKTYQIEVIQNIRAVRQSE